MDASSAQLALDIRQSIAKSLQARRPLLQHLNADTTWLLSIPRPEIAAKRGGRHWFNILLDPWLAGSQSDVTSWLSEQWHATESKVDTIAAVEELARETEILTSGLRLGKERLWNGSEEAAHIESFIDAVAISHEFTDHCHKETLLQVHKDVPVFATQTAAPRVRSWKHFRTVITTPSFSSECDDWRDVCLSPLPNWIGIAVLTSKVDALYYHSALMIVFNNRQRIDLHSEAAEAVIYTPHGIHAPDLAVVANASPPVETLAFLHGLHDISLGKFGSKAQLNLGAHNGLEAQRLLGAKYWIGTHDEVKRGGGLVPWFLQRKVITVKEALELESQRSVQSNGKEYKMDEILKDINFTDVANGESVILV